MDNEFAQYSLEELQSKKSKIRKRQIFIMAVCGLVILILAIVAVVKGNSRVFQLVPFLLISGVLMPYLIFNPMLKKIQQAIDVFKT